MFALKEAWGDGFTANLPLRSRRFIGIIIIKRYYIIIGIIIGIILSKYKTAKNIVLDPHPEQIIADLQKGFPGVLLSGTSCGLSDVHTPKPMLIWWFYFTVNALLVLLLSPG